MLLTARVSTSLAIAVAGLLAACGDSPTSPAGEIATGAEASTLRAMDTEEAGWSIVSCPPAQQPRDVTGLIGPEGGILSMGPYTLRIPEGALATPVMLRLTSPPGARLIVRLEVVGTTDATLAKPAELTIRYGHCPRQDMVRRDVRVLQLTGTSSITTVASDVEEDGESFTLLTRLLSTFAVAY